MQANPNHIVVNTKLNTAVLPGNIASMLRDVTLQDDFRVNGGVYAYNLTAEGNGTVTGPVLVRREAILRPPDDPQKRLLFQAGLFAGVSVLTQVSDQKKASPVHDEGCFPLVVRGDIVAPTVSLENTVVVGNIHSADAVLKDSIIMGGPTTTPRSYTTDPPRSRGSGIASPNSRAVSNQSAMASSAFLRASSLVAP